MSEIRLMERVRNWMVLNWRPILMFFLPFIRTYIGIDPPLEPIGHSNQMNQPNQTNEPSQINESNQANHRTIDTPPQNRVYVERRGAATNIDEALDLTLTATYNGPSQLLNDANVERRMPEGADTAIFGEGPTVRAQKLGNIIINETFGPNPNSQN